jgi:hypothetical protein
MFKHPFNHWNMKKFDIPYSLCFLGLVLLVTGCGPTLPKGFPKLYPTILTVTQEGQPLADADVLLYSATDSSLRWVVSGRTDASGQAQLKTVATAQISVSGAPLGKFKVTVIKNRADEIPVLSPVASSEEMAAHRAKMVKLKPKIYWYVEEQYIDVGKTPIEIEIQAKKNVIAVDAGKKLERAVPIPTFAR